MRWCTPSRVDNLRSASIRNTCACELRLSTIPEIVHRIVVDTRFVPVVGAPDHHPTPTPDRTSPVAQSRSMVQLLLPPRPRVADPDGGDLCNPLTFRGKSTDKSCQLTANTEDDRSAFRSS